MGNPWGTKRAMFLERRIKGPICTTYFLVRLRVLAALWGIACLLACSAHAGPQVNPAVPSAEPSTNAGSPASLPPEVSGPPAGYRLGPEDVFNVLVVNEPELTTVARVGRDGFIEMPLVGRIKASGLTVEELTRKIEEALRSGYLANPDVQIILQQYRQDVVHLFGQVGTPGPFRLTHGDTLLEVISKAGGFTPIAKRKAVRILRKEGDRTRVIVVNVRRILDEGRLEEDVPLMPGDVVIVPERFF